ncbi:MAG TPA: AzlD domain-containing protein [Ilumatobacter sp.]|nr:AzlD domain-containing protein [Ilumatobacter sp.]
MSFWSSLAIVVTVAAITYAMRACVIVGLAGRTIPVSVERSLRNVGPAVLAALAVNLAAGGEGGLHLEPEVAAALVAAGAVAWWRRSVIWSLSSGMAVLWLVAAIG